MEIGGRFLHICDRLANVRRHGFIPKQHARRAAALLHSNHHVIDVRESRQQLFFDTASREIHRRRDALHHGGDAEDIAGARAAAGIREAFECVAFERRERATPRSLPP